VNCAAIAETLQESELFGHERGAFTGATEQRKGRFEQADQGTIFLDEIGELSLSLQAKLLRVIQERSFHRIGGAAEVTSDFRLVAATHRDLRADVEAGTFRQDLYFRVAVLELHVPPLREREGDVALLSRHFLDELARQTGTDLSLSPDAGALLESFPWPGNVRQLANVIQKAAVFCETHIITEDDLPDEVRQNGFRPASPEGSALESSRGGESRPDPGSRGERPDAFKLDSIERTTIMAALEAAKGNVPLASRLLGISRPTLYRKLKTYRIR